MISYSMLSVSNMVNPDLGESLNFGVPHSGRFFHGTAQDRLDCSRRLQLERTLLTSGKITTASLLASRKLSSIHNSLQAISCDSNLFCLLRWMCDRLRSSFPSLSWRSTGSRLLLRQPENTSSTLHGTRRLNAVLAGEGSSFWILSAFLQPTKLSSHSRTGVIGLILNINPRLRRLLPSILSTSSTFPSHWRFHSLW